MLLKICKTAVFIILALSMLLGINYLLSPSKEMTQFYAQEKESIDVLVVGSSASYANINPAVLWSERGIAAYDLCASGQPVYNTYYYLKEAFKTQKPQLVVYDIYTMVSPEEHQDLDGAAVNTSGISLFSENRTDAIKASVSDDNFLDAYLGFPIYHKNYNTLINDPRKFLNVSCHGSKEKGYERVNGWAYYSGDVTVADGYEPIPEKNLEYLMKIISLVKENNAELLLIKCPYTLSEYHDRVYNSVEKVALENGVGYLNMNKCYQDIGFDYFYDIADIVHLNGSGSDKVSAYLANYISANYDIADHRGDSRYSSWQEYADLFSETGFRSPANMKERSVFKSDCSVAGSVTDSGLLYFCPVELKSNTYYKIKMIVSSDEDIHIPVDFWGAEYGGSKQSMVFEAKAGTDSELSTVIYSDEVPDDAVYFRILGSYDNVMEISSFEIFELH